MEPFGRSPECNKVLPFHEEIQQVLYPQCGLMKCVCCWGAGVGGEGKVVVVGFPAKGGESVNTCAVICFFQLLH